MNNQCSAIYAHRLSVGELDNETADWIVRGFEIWIRNGGVLPLDRCLGLPSNPKNLKIATRNYWLIEASKLIPANSYWHRACLLKKEADKFHGWQWDCWKSRMLPPAHATELQKLLFCALKSGAYLPSTNKQYQRIISDI
jgi:hypothetical protein